MEMVLPPDGGRLSIPRSEDRGLSPHFGKLIEQVENPQRLPELIRFNTTLVERRTTSVLTSGYQAVYNEF